MGPAWRRNYLRYRRFFLTFFASYQDREGLKIFLEILLTLVTISLFSLFALRPTLITIAQLIKEIESKKATIATMDQKIDNLSLAQTIYDAEIGKIRLLEITVPHTPTPETFARQLEGLAAKYSVSILSISTSETTLLGANSSEEPESVDGTPVGSKGEISFTTRISADYTQLFNFLGEIDKLRRPFDLDTLSINLSRTPDGIALVLVINGRVPYLRDTLNVQQ